MTNERITERIKAMEKIEKLLAMTSEKGATDGEVQNAILLAQRLMVKYQIEERELNLGTSSTVKVTHGLTWYKAKAQWSLRLLHIVANNFRCKSYLSNGSAAFIGEETDSDLAVKMYKMIFDAAERGTKRIRRQYRKEGLRTDGVADSYLIGFLKGLEEAFEAQKEAMVQENSTVALILVTPQAVVDEFTALVNMPTTKSVKGRKLRSSGDNRAYGMGKTDGRNSLNKQIEG